MLLLAAASVGCMASAQDAPPSPARLALGTDSLEIYLVRGVERQRIGMVWDELTRVTDAGGAALRRVYRTENTAFGPTLDSTYSRWVSFAPVSHRSDGLRSAVSVAYHAGSAFGQRAAGGRPAQRIERALSPGTYDGASFDLMVRAAPLAPGFALVLPGYIAVSDTVAQLSARVVATERLPRADGAPGPEVWRVEMDFAGLASTMWIAKVDRRMVRQSIQLAPQISVLMVRPGVVPNGA